LTSIGINRTAHQTASNGGGHEGGVRVPLIVHCPGKMPAGSVCNQATINVDFYPMLLEATISLR
jgi:arylsulfatase A-like enzyme